MANNKPIKLSEEGVRLCGQEGCEFPATHAFIWAQQGWQYQCSIHTHKMLGLEGILGFNIAQTSVRTMTQDEMMPTAHVTRVDLSNDPDALPPDDED